MGNQIDTFSGILPYQAIATFSPFNCAQERRKHFKPHSPSQTLLFYASQKFPKCETLSGTRKPLRGRGDAVNPSPHRAGIESYPAVKKQTHSMKRCRI